MHFMYEGMQVKRIIGCEETQVILCISNNNIYFFKPQDSSYPMKCQQDKHRQMTKDLTGNVFSFSLGELCVLRSHILYLIKSSQVQNVHPRDLNLMLFIYFFRWILSLNIVPLTRLAAANQCGFIMNGAQSEMCCLMISTASWSWDLPHAALNHSTAWRPVLL